jgi:GT2 family glycosyltransferase
VLLNFERAALTIQCARSILQADEPATAIVIVDNRSSDADFGELETFVHAARIGAAPGPELHLIRSDRNGGFASGCNLGIRHALRLDSVGWVWLLNNDAVVRTRHFRQHIQAFFERVGERNIASSMVYQYDSDAIWFEGAAFVPALGLVRHVGQEQFERARHPFLSGCSLLIPVSLFPSLGFLNESYFMYWEDVEYSVRARELGIGLRIITDLHVAHIGGGSIGKGNVVAYRQIANLFTLLGDHFPMWVGLSAGLTLLAKGTGLVALRGPKIGFAYLTEVVKGIGRILRLR